MESEDDDLNISIAMSLQSQEDDSSAKQMTKFDSKSGSSSVEDLAQHSSTSKNMKQMSPSHPSKESQPMQNAVQPVYGIPGLDRKRDEEARLERLARKRKAPESLSRQEDRSGREKRSKIMGSKAAEVIDLTEDSVPKHLESQSVAGPKQPSAFTGRRQPLRTLKRDNVTPETSNDSTNSGLEYPHGTIKKTWVFGYERNDDIKIEEVLRKQDLNIAVLSSFQWDMEWITNKLDQTRTKMIFVMQAKEEATREQYRRETAYAKHVRLCFPPMDGQVNCMHSKLMLLFHTDYLRVVVPTANLVPYDWGETGVMENTVFLIDLPRRSRGQPDIKLDENNSTHFQREFIYFLESMDMYEDVRRGVLNFDFSATANIAFVHTIGGSHMGNSLRRTGYCGLGQAVRTLDLNTDGPLEVDFVASSIGSLNQGFLEQIYLAAKGNDGLTEYERRTSKPKGQKKKENSQAEATEQQLSSWVQEKFRIYFPTEETVLESRGGPGNGGTICFQSKWYHSDTFPRSLMRDCKSRRKGLLMHNKILYARYQTPKSLGNGRRYAGWAYLGSANLSESAWGKLTKDRASGGPKLNCRNWECGIVLPTHLHGDASSTMNQPVGMDVFQGHLPLPMWLPGQPYGDRSPWFYSQHGL